MDYKAGMILSPPEHEHHRALKPRKIIAVDEEGGVLWVCVNSYKPKVAYAYPIETFERWTEFKGVNL